MRSKHDNVTFLEQRQGDVVTRAGASSTKPLQVEGASHPEFPLERVFSHSFEPFQLTFARNARQHFLLREDVEVVASHQGLTIRAETEDAIDAAKVVLEDLYGANLRIGQPKVRYHQGTSLEQPWMGLSIRCATETLETVSADLLDRGATILSCDLGPTKCVIQARAPLAALLGYRSALWKLTAGTARHAMWLSHYSPIESPPPDGHAA